MTYRLFTALHEAGYFQMTANFIEIVIKFVHDAAAGKGIGRVFNVLPQLGGIIRFQRGRVFIGHFGVVRGRPYIHRPPVAQTFPGDVGDRREFGHPFVQLTADVVNRKGMKVGRLFGRMVPANGVQQPRTGINGHFVKRDMTAFVTVFLLEVGSDLDRPLLVVFVQYRFNHVFGTTRQVGVHHQAVDTRHLDMCEPPGSQRQQGHQNEPEHDDCMGVCVSVCVSRIMDRR